MPSLLQDLRYALRQIWRAPGFVALVLLTLAAGIGLSAAIFTVVDCVLLRPLGYRDADHIVALRTHHVDTGKSLNAMGGDDYSDLARDVNGLEATAFYSSEFSGVRVDREALYLRVAAVSPRFGQVMGVQPVAGRLFRGDDAEGTEALVGAAFAREHFGSAGAALGQVLHIGPLTRVVVGVLPDGFAFPAKSQAWLEVAPRPETASRTAYNQAAVGRRRDGVSSAQLTAELQTFSRRLQADFPEDKDKLIEAVPLQEEIVGRVRPTLRLLMGAVAVVLLILGTNLANLQIVRGTRRLRAATIRTALGASRGALARQALLESALLAVFGSWAGVVVAEFALKSLLKLAPADVPRLAEVHLNTHVLLFSAAMSFALMMITAVLPLVHSWSVDPASALRNDTARGMESRGAGRLRNGLLVAEVAFTLVLSVAAVLLARQLEAQSHIDLGFAADRLLVLDTHRTGTVPVPDPPQNASPAQREAYIGAAAMAARTSLAKLDATVATVQTTPEVASTGAILGAPMGFSAPDVNYAIRGRQVFGPGNKLPNADVRIVTPGLFAALDIPVLHGRGFAPGDRLFAPSVALINATLAREQFPGQDPIGKQIMCGLDFDSSWWTIVGIVGDIHMDAPGTAPYPTLYVPVAQHPGNAGDMQLVVRTNGSPAAMAETLRSKLRSQDPDLAVKPSTMTQNIAEVQRLDTFRTVLFGGFAALSLLLAGVGMYGVTAYSVGQRRFEFGLRLAVGATRDQLLTSVLRGALSVALLGSGLGLLLSLGMTRLLGSALGKLPAFDATAYALAVGGVLLLATCAAWRPARRAAAAEPMQVLRYE